MPWFDERFRGYGRNKIVFVAALNATGFSFVVDHRSYVVHRPHEATRGAEAFSADARLQVPGSRETICARVLVDHRPHGAPTHASPFDCDAIKCKRPFCTVWSHSLTSMGLVWLRHATRVTALQRTWLVCFNQVALSIES
jgi:hypothetical protein